MLQKNTPYTQLEAILSDLAASGVTDVVAEHAQDWSTPVRPAPTKPAIVANSPVAAKSTRAQKSKKAAPLPKKVKPLNGADFIATSGDATAPLTIITATLPDQSAHMPFAAAEQRLLSNMLRAIGHTLEGVNFATIMATDDAGTPLTKSQITELHAAAKTALADLKPQNILCFGQLATSVFIAGEAIPIAACRKAQPQAGKANTVTTYHPRHLLKSPQYKHLAWQDLQPFVKEVLA